MAAFRRRPVRLAFAHPGKYTRRLVAKATDPKDPRFKPFRTGMTLIYLLVVGVFSALVIFSIFRSVVTMSPRRPAQPPRVLTVGECVDGAEALWQELEGERKRFTDTHPAQTVDEKFSRFRVDWVRRLRELEGQCAIESRNRKPLRALFDRLDEVVDLYTTHAVQYAGEVGPAVDTLEAAFDEARRP